MEPGTLDGNVTPSRRFLVCVALVGLLLGAVALWGTNKQALGLFHDDGIYVVVAKSISQAEGYRIISLPGAPAQTKYPFLYPYILSAIWRICPNFPQNIVAFKAVNAFILVGIFFLSSIFYRRCFSRPGFGAVIFSTLVCASPIIFTFTDYVISDLLFVLLVLAALTLCAVENDEPASTIRTMARISLLAAVTGLALLTRLAAAPLVLSGGLFSFRSQRWRGLGVFAALLALFVAPWLLWMTRHSEGPANSLFVYYSAYEFPGTGGESLVERATREFRVVAGNACYLLESFEMFYVTPLLPGLGLFVGALTFVGMVKSLGKELANWSFFLSSLILLISWPFHPGRYLAPLAALLVLYLFRGAKAIETWLSTLAWNSPFKPIMAKLAWTPVAFVLVLMCVWVSGFLLVRDDQSTRSLYGNRVPYRWDGFQESFAWIRAHAPADALLATAYDPMYYLYTGRRAIRPALHRPTTYFYPYGRANPNVGSVDEIRPQLDQLKANYLILDPLDGYVERSATSRLFDQLVLAYGDKAKNVFTSSDGKHRIYELSTD